MTRTKAELQAINRDGPVCRRCGRNVEGRQASLHHRQPRGMGGGTRDRYDRPENLAVLCGTGTTGCHGWVESHRTESYRDGWLVRRGADPAEQMLITTEGCVVMLLDDGSAVVGDPVSWIWPEVQL